MTHTIEQTKDALKSEAFTRMKPVLDLIQKVITAAGTEGIPSGHLYARLMGFMSLNTYELMIALMVEAGGVTVKNSVLRATTKGG